YPSALNVGGSGTVQNVQATITGFDANEPDTVDILLQHGTTKVMLMSDAGDTQSTLGSPRTLTFDNAGSTFPNWCDGSLPVTAGPWKPVDCAKIDFFNLCPDEPSVDTFPAPGPGTGPFGTDLTTFNGANQSGAWNLWVVNDCWQPQVTGTMTSWSLTLTTS